jgi:alkanesulfonate monooxygenase SsuD/methylene tetrahydromethanopterin reductase-like flavin-dependent oxidoreductase (luciferase family)
VSARFGLLCTADTDTARSINYYVDYCVEAEALGFESTFLVEHHFSGWNQVSAPFLLQTCVAMRTSTLRLGTGVIVLPWHNPVLVAEAAATLDVLSNGRVDLGVGKGYRFSELHGFDVTPADADSRFEEALGVLLRAWTTRDRFSHDGKWWRFNDIVVEPPPVQTPGPPVWIAAASEASIRRAASLGHRLLLDQYASVAQIAERIRSFGGREVAVARQAYVGYNRDEIDAALERQAAFTQRTVRVSQDAHASGGSHVLAYDNTEANALFGTLDDVISGLKDVVAAGTDYVLLNLAGGREQLRRFATEVAPAV